MHNKRNYFVVGLSILLTFALFMGCSQVPDSHEAIDTSEPANAATSTDYPMVEIAVKDYGNIIVELDEDAAPLTVENFLKLADEGFYDGLIFHRVVPGFVIQGGDPEGTGMGGASDTVAGEFASNDWDNPISHERGIISMARAVDPDSASSQFFITVADASGTLDGDYAAFGKIVEGMDVVDKIAAVDCGTDEKPLEDVVMETVQVVA